MSGKGITIIRLGPGDSGSVTRRAWDLMVGSKLVIALSKGPVIQELPESVQVLTYYDLFDAFPHEMALEELIDDLLHFGKKPEGVTFANGWHPLIEYDIPEEIVKQAEKAGIPVRIIDNGNYLEQVFTAINEPEVKSQVTIVSSQKFSLGYMPSFPPDAPALILYVYYRDMAIDIKRELLNVYPPEHEVQIIYLASESQFESEIIQLSKIDESKHLDHWSALYIPPLSPATSFEGFQEIIAHLRSPEGCPWDREQTHQTLRTNLLEETYEVLSAIDANDPVALGEELGDLLLQIVLQTQIASEYGEFRMTDVIHGIHTKLVRRHPHVFSDLEVAGVADVLQNWEMLKAAERQKKGRTEAGLLDSTPKALPALTQAEQYQARVARVGFEWPELSDVLDKIQEEIEEVRQAQTPQARQDELGDLLFALVNLARRFDIDSESALREANARFRRRFTYVEDSARLQNRVISELSLEEMLALWDESKQQGL